MPMKPTKRPLIQRQELFGNYTEYTARFPEDLYNELSELAYSKRVTIAALITHFTESGIRAEAGAPYMTFAERSEKGAS